MEPVKRVPTLCGLVAVALLCGMALGSVGWSRASEEQHAGGAFQAAQLWDLSRATPAITHRAARHRAFLQEGVPLEYRSRKSPYPAVTMAVRAGGALYRAKCSECHGANGLGDGAAGKDLTPPPALLAYLIERRRSVDEYLLWTISEGGTRFGSEMPAFKGLLDESEIWQIIIYMRSGFPPPGETGQD